MLNCKHILMPYVGHLDCNNEIRCKLTLAQCIIQPYSHVVFLVANLRSIAFYIKKSYLEKFISTVLRCIGKVVAAPYSSFFGNK